MDVPVFSSSGSRERQEASADKPAGDEGPKQKVKFHDASNFASDGSGRSGNRSSWMSEGTASITSHMYRKWWAINFVRSPAFDSAIGMVILANAVLIGVEQQWDLHGHDTTIFGHVEHALLCIYIVELLLRLWAVGARTCVMDNWWRFDAFLVVTSVACFWVIFPVWGVLPELQSMAMLRMLRLLRLARAVRLVPLFRELWMLVQGLLVSGKTIVYTIMLIGVILYLYAVMAIELITNNPLASGEDADPDFQKQVENHFSSLPAAILTLIQFVSFDNVVLIYEPLVRQDWKLAVYFISIIVLVGILLMNLVTAVVVNNALEQAMADKEIAKAQEDTQKKKLIKELRKVFMRLDDDGSGQITQDEIERIQPEDREMLAKLLGVSDPMELFNALDADGSGEVDVDEFCNGVWAVCISKSPIELKRTEKMVEFIRDQLRESAERMSSMMERLEALEELSVRLAESSAGGDAVSGPSTPLSPTSPMSTESGKRNKRGKDAGFVAERAAGAEKPCDPAGRPPPGLQACVREAMRQALLELGGPTSAPCGVASPTTPGAPLEFGVAAVPEEDEDAVVAAEDEGAGVAEVRPAGAEADASTASGPRVEHL